MLDGLRRLVRLFRPRHPAVIDEVRLPSLGDMRAARAMGTRRRGIDERSAEAARRLEMAMEQPRDVIGDTLTRSRERG